MASRARPADFSPDATVENTPRSSFTLTEKPSRINLQQLKKKPSGSEVTDPQPLPHVPLGQEISQDEEEFERYGGDAVEDPAPKTPALDTPIISPPPKDPNMVTWDGPDDPKNPQNWSVGYKWFITVLCIVMTVNVTFASSAPSSASQHIIREWGISSEVSYLVTTTFLLGYVFGPLFWGPGSELTGRRPVFVVAMVCYTLFILGQALAPNIETLLITRFFSGFFAVAPLTNCGGVIADIWSAEGRGPSTSLFTASVFLGPVLGPIVSGFIVNSSASWRWVFWVMFIFAGVCTLIMLPLLPETYSPVILNNKAKQLRKADPEGAKELYAEHEKQDWSAMGIVHRTIFRPFKMLAMEPILVLITVYLSFVYGMLFCLFQAFPIIFIKKHGFTIAEDGLIFIGVGIGTTIGSLVNFLLSRHYPQLIKKWKGFPPPEERLFGAMIGGPLLVIACFWLGWTGHYSSVPWYVPGLSTIAIGAAISLIFMSFLSYLVDTYLMFSASAFAANTVIRSAVAAAFPLFTVQMFTNLGVNWAASLIGFLALLFAPIPFLFYKYGPAIRTRSTFAPCIDLKIAQALKAEEDAKTKFGSEKV